MLNPHRGVDVFGGSHQWMIKASNLGKEIKVDIEGFCEGFPLLLRKAYTLDSTIYSLQIVKEIPDNLSLRIQDYLVSLRTSLDLLVSEASSSLGFPDVGGAFPFGRDESDARGRRNSKNSQSSRIPGPLFEILLKSEPFKESRSPLWMLNHAAGKAKHNSFITLKLRCVAAVIEKFESTGTIKRGVMPPVWDYESQSMFIAEVVGGELTYTGTTIVDIVFDEPELMYAPCVDLMSVMFSSAKMVRSDVIAFVQSQPENLR